MMQGKASTVLVPEPSCKSTMLPGLTLLTTRMVDVVRLEYGALLLDADSEFAGAINTVLVKRGVRVKEIRKQTIAER